MVNLKFPNGNAGIGAALVLAHLEQYHRPEDSTKIFFKPLPLIIIEWPIFCHIGGFR